MTYPGRGEDLDRIWEFLPEDRRHLTEPGSMVDDLAVAVLAEVVRRTERALQGNPRHG